MATKKSVYEEIRQLGFNVANSPEKDFRVEFEKLNSRSLELAQNYDILRERNDELVKKVESFSKNADNAIREENIILQKKIDDLDVELSTMRNDFFKVHKDFVDATVEKEQSEKKLLEYQNKVAEALQTAEKIETNVKVSYSAEDLSAYLNQAISDFNKNAEAQDGPAKYIINSMDVDLKAQIFHDEESKVLRFCAPNLEKITDESLSTIKISIRAVPK